MNASLRIVIADDEPDMREYFQKLLPRLGHRVVGAAPDGRALLELCRKERPDQLRLLKQRCGVPWHLPASIHELSMRVTFFYAILVSGCLQSNPGCRLGN